MPALDPKKVVVAMSGGVDSSVAALILKNQGFQVVGITMRLYNVDEASLPAYYQGCCTLDDVEDARRVCELLGVPHYVLDVRREFQTHVIDYFISEYQRGNTPHPCIACNDSIKFSFLSQRARFLEAQYVATGHYARVQEREDGYHLLKGMDHNKDQSYVLYGMGQTELSHTLLPVGCYAKEEIRQMAREAGFPNAAKPDSQEICFIPMGDYRKFLAERVSPKPGRLVSPQGEVLGEHTGIEFFTVGQRRGLGITSPKPLYVTAIDPSTGDVTIGGEEDLWSSDLLASRVRYVSGREPPQGAGITVKIRYKSAETAALLYPQGHDAVLSFSQPQRAVSPGQAAVFYQDDEVLGGGRIVRSLKESGPEALPLHTGLYAKP